MVQCISSTQLEQLCPPSGSSRPAMRQETSMRMMCPPNSSAYAGRQREIHGRHKLHFRLHKSSSLQPGQTAFAHTPSGRA